jgi:hypothetical protein
MDLTPMGSLLWGHLKELNYAVPPRPIKDLLARLQAAVTMVNANMLKCVQETGIQCTDICLEMDGGCFN